MNEKWRGGDMMRGPGGGHKINLLKSALKDYKDDKNTIIMFTDRYIFSRMTFCDFQTYNVL